MTRLHAASIQYIFPTKQKMRLVGVFRNHVIKEEISKGRDGMIGPTPTTREHPHTVNHGLSVVISVRYGPPVFHSTFQNKQRYVRATDVVALETRSNDC